MILERVRWTQAAAWSEPLLRDQDRMAALVGRPEWIVELVLVDEVEMQRLNGTYRERDAVTDVLSFSELLDSGRGQPDLPAGTGDAACDLWLDPLGGDVCLAGQIVMAPQFIEERCRERGWDPDDEVAMLTAHGLLHLLGWDHANAVERRAMQDREIALLAVCGRGHPMRDEEAV